VGGPRSGYGTSMPTATLWRDQTLRMSAATARRRRPRRRVVVVLVALAVAGLAITWWVSKPPAAPTTVAVVGDSITYLSRADIAARLDAAGYHPTVVSLPGTKLAQAEATVARLASTHPDIWVMELGTNDAGSKNPDWATPFNTEWREMASAGCVIYVSVSPRVSPVGDQINAAIRSLAARHGNVHVLDWGALEYTHSGWLRPDGIHPTPAGQEELQAIQQHC